MAGRRIYGGSNMAVLLQNEGISPEAIQALLASGSSPGGFHGSRSMVTFEDIRGGTPERSFFRPVDIEETGDEDFDDSLHQPEKKRRLTTNQVQFLERSFELENKLDPEKKIQLARDLGLQPRQVAIWFQNRRARWRTKQLEKDYEALKSSFNVIKADYESLLKGKERLKAEVLVLTDKLLLKDKKGNSETVELNKSHNQSQKPDTDSVSDAKNSDVPVVVCKQEDLSSANSAVFDSDSPHYTEGGGRSPTFEPMDSSNFLEPAQSGISHAGEDEEVGCRFLKLEENSCNYEFPVEDQAFWFWPY